jgi:chromosome partitioning protein
LRLLSLERNLVASPAHADFLKVRLNSVKNYYNFIFIDMPHSLDALLMNGLKASDHIIIPLSFGVFSLESLDTLKVYLEQATRDLGIDFNVLFILLLLSPSRNLFKKENSEIKQLVKEFLGNNFTEPPRLHQIPWSSKVLEAQIEGLPISHYAAKSNVSKVYQGIANELITQTL